MAPRESTNVFHDQFLQFDYESTTALLPAPPLDVGGPADVDPHHSFEPSEGEALSPPGTETAADVPSPRSDPAAQAPIDPLSIDPTTEDVSVAWSLVAPVVSVSVAGPPSGRAVRSVTSSVGSTRSVAVVTHGPERVLSPLSTGSMTSQSEGPPTAGPPHSPNTTTSSTSFHSARTSHSPRFSWAPPPTNGPADSPRNHSSPWSPHSRQVSSMLDDVMSLEDGEDASGPVPLLERTFDSTVTSTSSWVDRPEPALAPWVATPTAMGQQPEQEQEMTEDPSEHLSTASSVSTSHSRRSLYRNAAFDDTLTHPTMSALPLSHSASSSCDDNDNQDHDDHHDDQDNHALSPTTMQLSFGTNTTVADLKYFAERGCIVPLLQALDTPRLVTLGARMLADYAKMAHRRVAVASNKRILEFVQRTMVLVLEHNEEEHPEEWLGREYAVETVRSLTATEESDPYLMAKSGLLPTLALVARGGPFRLGPRGRDVGGLASDKARLHACIAIMNLSCGKANKIEIAKCPEVLESMRDVMLGASEEARLKATTCIKNLSNADANDAALLGTKGLVEALAHVAAVTCSFDSGASSCTTNACLALMNLSIAKANKHRVYRTPGTMDALMTVLKRTKGRQGSSEARVKACSALSNLAIGYDNKIPMFHYPGFVETILDVIDSDSGEARTKACSILWSFAAEMKNQVPVVQRGDILPVLIRVAEEDDASEARFKCVAALTLLAESLENVIPLLEAGALHPLMDILHDAGPDPTQWKGQTASWCVGFLMNIAQSDEAVPLLRDAGVVELLAPLLTLDHYQSLKAAMAVTFVCRYDEGDECYDLLRKTENVIPKIISLLHNTLAGRGGNGYKYGVFTLRSSVGCISALASGPEFMKERIATGPVFESLLRVITDFCVDGGTPGAIVGGGRDDILSATLAMRAIHALTAHLIPVVGSSGLPFGSSMEERLLIALESYEACPQTQISEESRALAADARMRIEGSRNAARSTCNLGRDVDSDMDAGDVAFLASNCCGFDTLPCMGEDFLRALSLPSLQPDALPASASIVTTSSVVEEESPDTSFIRTFLLTDSRTGRRFVVPCEQSGGRSFNDTRQWCYRRGRFCGPGETPDASYVWTPELQAAYEEVLMRQHSS